MSGRSTNAEETWIEFPGHEPNTLVVPVPILGVPAIVWFGSRPNKRDREHVYRIISGLIDAVHAWKDLADDLTIVLEALRSYGVTIETELLTTGEARYYWRRRWQTGEHRSDALFMTQGAAIADALRPILRIEAADRCSVEAAT